MVASIARGIPKSKLVKIIAGENECGDGPMSDFAFAISISNLEELDLQSNKITDLGGVLLAKAISKCDKLVKLNLANNELMNETARVLSVGLRNNKKLCYLNLDGNIMKLDYVETV